jgi:hypothetical protein
MTISHNTLMSLKILDAAFGVQNSGNVHTIPGAVLKCLSVFSQIREVHLNPRCRFQLDNALLKEMAKAWPHLQELDVGTKRSSGGLSHVTLPGLIPLVEHCPDLHFIGMVLDATDLTGLPEAMSGSRPPKAKLKTVDVGDSKVDGDLREIAAFLSGIVCKDVKICHNFQQGTTVFPALWDQIGEMIPYFVRVREQERLLWRN